MTYQNLIPAFGMNKPNKMIRMKKLFIVFGSINVGEMLHACFVEEESHNLKDGLIQLKVVFVCLNF